ncbi:MAG: hypothetical protein J6D42_04565 [Clostridia bacterium]|nr:hypothetical protein [Clostridia bacterium]
MISALFSQILQMSIASGIAIIFVIIFRLLLKSAPKIFSYMLWAVVLFRLLCPINIMSDFSLAGIFTEKIEEFTDAVNYQPTDFEDVIGEIEPDNIVTTTVTPRHSTIHIGNTTFPNEPEITVRRSVGIIETIWISGIIAIAGYNLIGFIKLKRKLVGSVMIDEGVYISDGIPSPFVVGLIFPKIYIPSDLSDDEKEYIICHEKHHIRRHDNIIKAIAFVALCIHWFNPLVWIAFSLFVKDMEMSCDEAVIRKFGDNIKADYAQSLLDFSIGKNAYSATPLAFGEGNTETRIKNIAKFKKPAHIVIIAAIAIVSISTVVLITNPANKNTELLGANYHINKIIYMIDDATPKPVQYCISADYRLFLKQSATEDWDYLGQLEKDDILASDLKKYLSKESAWVSRFDIKKITDCYILRTYEDNFYIVVQTSDGKTLLGYGWEDKSERDDEYSDDTYIKELYLLESEFRRHGFNVNFFDRSLKYTVGKNVSSFSYYENEYYPGFAIVGFRAGHGSIETMTDLGFAVFSYAENIGYKLIDWHLYLDAAINGEKIYTCEHPAVFSINGVKNYMNSFDVVLSAAPELHKISRVYSYEDKGDVTIEDETSATVNMALFKRNYRDGTVSVMQYYYDEYGNCIGSEDVTVSSNFTDIQGTSYVSWRELYMTPISSFMALGGDSGARYIIGDDSFSICSKTSDNIQTFDNINYEWQKFPWTEEEWNEMFIYNVPDEMKSTNGMLWQPLSDRYGLIEKDNTLYILTYSDMTDRENGLVWSIYELIEESAVGFAEWKYEPYLSSKLPCFQFEFDIENYTHVTAIALDGGTLLNYDSEGDPSPGDKTYKKGTPIRWSPRTISLDAIAQIRTQSEVSEIYFDIFNGDTPIYHGIIYIKPGSDPDAYSATIGGYGLKIGNDPDFSGAVISVFE